MNHPTISDIILTQADRKMIFTMFEKWKEATRPTDRNCNCVNDAMGRFDSIEYQQGQPGVEPINWEKFRHVCKEKDDYGYFWNGDSMEWEPPHTQTCDAWQNGYDCMHNEGDYDKTIFNDIYSDTKVYEKRFADSMRNSLIHDGVSHEIIYTHTKDGHEYSTNEDREEWACCECSNVDLIAVKAEDHEEQEIDIITATPLDFYNYIADTYPMTWIKWNLGNSNPLNQYTKSGHYNIHNEFVEGESC